MKKSEGIAKNSESYNHRFKFPLPRTVIGAVIGVGAAYIFNVDMTYAAATGALYGLVLDNTSIHS